MALIDKGIHERKYQEVVLVLSNGERIYCEVPAFSFGENIVKIRSVSVGKPKPLPEGAFFSDSNNK